MTNRTGKREREARNRHKRGYTQKYDGQTGARTVALKLGTKKRRAFDRSSKFKSFNVTSVGFPISLVMPAVPVAEGERR